MSDQYGSYQQPGRPPQQGWAQSQPQPYQQPGYPPVAYAPVPKRPPLTPRLKRSAAGAGILGFSLMSIGWTLFGIAAGIGLFAGFLALLFSATAGSSGASSQDLGDIFDGFDAAIWIGPLIGMGVVGILIWVGGLFASRGILRRAGHPRPWGVTWAAFGIAVVASWILGSIGSVIAQFASVFVPSAGGSGGLYDPSDGDSFEGLGNWLLAYVAVWGVYAILQIIITVVIGWLAWWWMAHAMRPAATAVQPHRY